MRNRFQATGWLWCAVACLTVGCTSTKSSNTVRTGTEQMLISNAIDQSLARVDFTPFQGRKIFVEEKYVECVDKNYVLSSLRHHLWRQGAEVMTKVEDADIVIEPRVGAVGTDSSDAFIGTPSLSVPGGLLSIPEIKLITRTSQTGTAKLGLVAYDAKTRETLGDGGTALARSSDHNWYVLGVGPWQQGSVRKEVDATGNSEWGTSPWMLPSNVAFALPLPGLRSTDDEASDAEAGHVELTSQEEAATVPPAQE